MSSFPLLSTAQIFSVSSRSSWFYDRTKRNPSKYLPALSIVHNSKLSKVVMHVKNNRINYIDGEICTVYPSNLTNYTDPSVNHIQHSLLSSMMINSSTNHLFAFLSSFNTVELFKNLCPTIFLRLAPKLTVEYVEYIYRSEQDPNNNDKRRLQPRFPLPKPRLTKVFIRNETSPLTGILNIYFTGWL